MYTTKALVKSDLDITTTTQDSLIDAYIVDASAIIDNFVGYTFTQGTHTEYRDMSDNPDTRVIYLKYRPLVSITSVTDNHGDGDVLTEDEDYYIYTDESKITFMTEYIGKKILEIIYVAGYDITTNDVSNLPQDIEWACRKLVITMYQERQTGGKPIKKESIGGWSVSFGVSRLESVDSVLSIRNVLNKYRNNVL